MFEKIVLLSYLLAKAEPSVAYKSDPFSCGISGNFRSPALDGVRLFSSCITSLIVETGLKRGLVLILKVASESSKGLTVPTVPKSSGVFLVDLIFRQKNVKSDKVSVNATTNVTNSMVEFWSKV